MISRKNLINGQWEEGKGVAFSSYNPVKEEKISDHTGASTSQVEAAVNSAAKAYQMFKTLNFDKRADFLEALANELEALGDELLEVCNEETGLGLPRLTGERGRTCGQLRAFANLVREGNWQQARIDTAIPDRAPLPKADIRRALMPLGPVAVFSASNFPLAFSTLGGDSASALAAGNTVVVKAHPSHPGTSELCAKAALRAIEKQNIPEGTFNLVQGAAPEVSADLVKNPSIEAVGFTGSTHVGRILYDLGASRPKPIPVFAEMGSTNPLFILPNAIKNRGKQIANGLSNSVTLGTGQFCTKPGLVFTLKSDENQDFKRELASAIQEVQIGYLLNSGIKKSLDNKLKEYAGKEELTKISGGDVDKGTVFTVSGSDFLKNPELEAEVFGPAAILVECDNIEEMMKVAQELEGHLTGTIHSDNDEEAIILKSILEEKVGRIIYNGFPTGVEVCPSMHHGGPYPSSTFGATTSVGTAAIERFCRVVCYQDAPQEHLPEALRNDNPRNVLRLLNGTYTSEKI